MSRENRRDCFRAALGLACLAIGLTPQMGCGLVQPRQSTALMRIGYMASTHTNDALFAAFTQRLSELGWIEGQNLTVEWRYTDGDDRLGPTFAAEFAHLPVDVIVCGYTPLIQAAKRATNTIPVVFTGDNDPVGDGLVASLAKPGGNVTGISLMSPQVGAKRVEFATQIVPGIALLAVLDDPTVPSVTLEVESLRTAAKALGVDVLDLKIATPDNLESAFRAAVGDRAGVLVVPSTNFFSSQRSWIVDLAAKYRLPTMYPIREYVDQGGLMSYGTNRRDDFRHAASFVYKVLRGAKPADLPVEQPTLYELVVNVRTMEALGLTTPASLAPLVTEWIQ